MHRDAVPSEARAKIELVESLGRVVAGIVFVMKLSLLEGRSRLDGYDVHSLITH